MLCLKESQKETNRFGRFDRQSKGHGPFWGWFDGEPKGDQPFWSCFNGSGRSKENKNKGANHFGKTNHRIVLTESNPTMLQNLTETSFTIPRVWDVTMALGSFSPVPSLRMRHVGLFKVRCAGPREVHHFESLTFVGVCVSEISFNSLARANCWEFLQFRHGLSSGCFFAWGHSFAHLESCLLNFLWI